MCMTSCQNARPPSGSCTLSATYATAPAPRFAPLAASMTARLTGRGFSFGGVRARAAALSASILLAARAAAINKPSAICTRQQFWHGCRMDSVAIRRVDMFRRQNMLKGDDSSMPALTRHADS